MGMIDKPPAEGRQFPGQVQVGVFDGDGPHHERQPVIQLTPKFQLFIFLAGQQKFYIDDVFFDMQAGEGADIRPVALVMNRVRKAELRHIQQPGQYLRKVMISAPVTWAEDLQIEADERTPELADFISGHLNHFVWWPQRHAVQLATEIVTPPPALMGEIRTLYCKAKALELMSLACAALVDRDRSHVAKSTASALRQSEKVRDYLLAHLDETLTIDEIARETGASVSSVQRHFKEHFGVTVFDFIRRKRLEKARDALERDGLTIAQAAYLAGYSNPNNFTAAFKKEYGLAPKFYRA